MANAARIESLRDELRVVCAERAKVEKSPDTDSAIRLRLLARELHLAEQIADELLGVAECKT
jgi:hypothetical protein